MKWAPVWLCVAGLWGSGCFEPVVGTQCADNQSLCGSRCVPNGTCAIDGGLDTGSLDSLGGTTEAGSPLAALDTAWPVDLSEGLDEGYDGAARAIDGSDGSASPQPDGATKDTRDAPAADRASTDTRDAPENDTRRADAPDVPSTTKDTRDAVSQDTRDAPAQDTKDATFLSAEDTQDAPLGPDASAGPEVADVPAIQSEVRADAADAADVGRDGTNAQDASEPADAAHDASSDRLDVARPESGPEAQPACPGQQVRCGGVCVDLQTNQNNCGLCGYACGQLPCIGGQCTSCPTPEILCNERCVDTTVDPANCGACGQVCASGACRFGECKASTAGHIVVIGHDFRTNNVAMSRLLGNAILFSTEGDVTVVEYVGVAGDTPVTNSHVAIAQVSSTVGRQVTLSSDVSYSASALASQLKSADVFLVQSQTVATNTILIELGESWASVLDNFVHTGGTIVVLDGSYPLNKGTSQIVSRAGLLSVSVVSAVNNETCSIATASDPVAASVPPTYPCLANSVVFSGDGTHVVEDLGRPVVLHVAF